MITLQNMKRTLDSSPLAGEVRRGGVGMKRLTLHPPHPTLSRKGRGLYGRVLFFLCCIITQPALAEMVVSSTVVKSGFFLAPDCKPTADPKAFNECVCEANIKKAQITGLAAEINANVNAGLALLPEKLAVESCEGTVTTAPTGGIKVNLASADYEIAYQTTTTLTVLITYSTYGAGAERALEGTEGFTFDLASGKIVDPINHRKPEQVAKADSFIKHELLKKYPVALTDEARARTEPYLTENGCDLCTMFYAKDGWVVRFQIDSIAPYLIGEPEVVIPADIMAAPETLMTQTKS